MNFRWVRWLLVAGLCGGIVEAQVSAVPASASRQAVEAQSDKFILPADLPLILRNKHPLSSELNRVGDVVEFEVVKAVTSGGTVLIAKGASAKGKVTLAEQKRRMGKGGELGVSIDTVELITGESVPVHAVWSDDGGGGKKLAGHMAIAGALLWPAAPLALLERGNSAELAPGMRFEARLTDEATLSRSAVEANQPHPEARMDVATVYLYREAREKDLDGWVMFACGEMKMKIYPEMGVGLELPPGGEYWFTSGYAAIGNLKTVKQKDALVRLTVSGGQTYYLKLKVNAKKRRYTLERVDAVAGDEGVTDTKYLSMRLVDELRPKLVKLQAQGTTK